MKGIKIFGALVIASLLFSVNAYAQENNNRDENGEIVRGPYETNKAGDNMFIAIAGGVNSVWEPGQGMGKIGLATDLNIGKWFTPAIGMRLGWHGLMANGKSTHISNAYFNYFHGDFMWNISNSIGGYKETRFWNIVPFLGAGVGVYGANNNKKASQIVMGNKEFNMSVGILNVLRLGNRVNLTLELAGIINEAHHVGLDAGKFVGWAMMPYATLGLSFNLGKTNFDRHSSITPVVIPVPFTTEQYNALKDKVAALEKENAALKDKVAALEKELAPLKKLVNGQTYLYENGTFTAVDVTPDAPITLYFNIGSDKLSAREKAHLEYFTQNVVNGDTKLSVNGYADKQTGSAKYNQALSEKRVKTVVDLLKKAGANEANIESAAHGATVQLFNGAAKNRVVTIEVK